MSASHVAILGDFNIFAAIEIRARLLAALDQADDIEVDLSQVTEADSAGVQLMVAAKAEDGARGKALRFVGHSPAVLDVLDLCDLTAHLGDPVLIRSRA